MPAAPAKQAHAAEAEAFNRIVAETSGRLFRLAARILGSQTDADDVLQESYVRAFHAWRSGRFAQRAGELTWLYAIVTRVALNALRARKRGASREQRWRVPTSSPLAAMEARAELGELAQWLDALTEDQRAVLVLKELEGLSTSEVAEILDCSVGAVEQRLTRARAALRERCDRE